MVRRYSTLRSALRRFGRARRGMAAVEFALVAVPFFMLTIGLAEVAMVGFAQSSLNFATSQVGRQVRTGQAQMNNLSYQDMQDQLCASFTSFLTLDCEERLYLDIDRFDSYLEAAAKPPPVSDGNFTGGGVGFRPGAPSEIVVVRAYYRWRVMTPMFERVLGNLGNGERLLVATMMFRNEPYQ